MEIEDLIEKKLEQTLECEFKRTILQHLVGKGWACVRIKKFKKELAVVIKDELCKRESTGKQYFCIEWREWNHYRVCLYCIQ